MKTGLSFLSNMSTRAGDENSGTNPATVKETSSQSQRIRKKKAKIKETAPRLNYFVAIQVDDSEVRNQIERVQNKMVESTVLLASTNGSRSVPGTVFKDTMVPVEKLHFTLHVVHLKDDEEKEKAKRAVEIVWSQCKDELKQTPIVVAIRELSHFRNNVIFAKMEGEEQISRLTTLSDRLRAEFELMNIIGETRPFKPHMTVAKISRSKKLYRKKIKSFPREMWSDMESLSFGNIHVKSLQLLSMQDKPDSEGYYQRLAEFHFN